ncbi:MAG TPA: DNA-directed RNA polymerase subunit omega [Phycisphaerae bacterium]|nr:DNA-directed RNA polymerase subunit omega [Phycisphaerae bacterium]
MIEELKNDDLINRIGGRFKFTAMIQKRWRELMMGARPMIEPGRLTPLEIAIKEIAEGKIKSEDPVDRDIVREK